MPCLPRIPQKQVGWGRDCFNLSKQKMTWHPDATDLTCSLPKTNKQSRLKNRCLGITIMNFPKLGLKKRPIFRCFYLLFVFQGGCVFVGPWPDKLDWTCLTFVPFPSFVPGVFFQEGRSLDPLEWGDNEGSSSRCNSSAGKQEYPAIEWTMGIHGIFTYIYYHKNEPWG